MKPSTHDVVHSINFEHPSTAARKLEALIDSRRGLKPEERALLVAVARRLREMEGADWIVRSETDLSKALKPFEGE
jgi:hypothetical protein